MPEFWEEGFWEEGFWAEGFWGEVLPPEFVLRRLPVVIAENGRGFPVTLSDRGHPVTEAPNGRGTPVTVVESRGFPVKFVS